jgi:plastocyanin
VEVVMRKRFAFLLAVGMLVASFAAQPASSAVVVKGVTCSTCASGYKWSPKAVTVATGTKVVWKSVNGSHNVTSISNNWSKATPLPFGGSTSYTFKRAGTYRFYCSAHGSFDAATKTCSGMCGKVVVG